MRKILVFAVALVLMGMAGCGKEKTKTTKEEKSDTTYQAKNDTAFYGLACDGCSDSVIVAMPLDGSDPIRFKSLRAFRRGRVLGDIQIGDRITVVRSKDNPNEAELVVDMDELKGIWCYIVMPRMRDSTSMSSAAQRRYLEQMPDSVKNTYLIPREYGFWLRANNSCQAVGYVQEQTALEEVSPVEYPPLGHFVQWHMWNGKVIIISDKPIDVKGFNTATAQVERDTCEIDYLKDDSLALSDAWGVRGYYRKKDINEVNVKAKAIAAKLSSEALKN